MNAAAPRPARATSLFARQLANFVDREGEMKRFRGVLATGETNVLVVCGESGSGKSSLLARMIHECSLHGRKKAEVFWSETRAYGYMGVMRKLRDDLGVAAFGPFTDLVNYYTKNDYKLTIQVDGVSSINVADRATVKGSTVGDIGGIIIKDLMFNAPRSDMAVPDEERMVRLTDRFLEDLKVVADQEPLMIFMDAVEKMTLDTDRWLWGELLPAVRDGRVPNAAVVLCGQKRPDLGHDWRSFVEVSELRPLSLEHIAEYLARRAVPESDRNALARMLLVATGGKASEIANHVEAYLGLA